MSKPIAHVKKHPAEYGAVGVYAALVVLLQSFDIDQAKAYAIIGVIAAVTPAVATWLRNRGWI